MPQTIPVQPVANQTLSITLNGQACSFNIFQKPSGLYVIPFVNDIAIVGPVIAQNCNRIVRSLYLGFSGDVLFADTQGDDDPVYTGLGTRWVFNYLFPSDLPSGVG